MQEKVCTSYMCGDSGENKLVQIPIRQASSNKRKKDGSSVPSQEERDPNMLDALKIVGPVADSFLSDAELELPHSIKL